MTPPRLALLLALLAAPPRPEPPRVHLLAPLPGWTTRRLVTVQGTVSDPTIHVAHVSVAGLDLPVNVWNGRFEVKLVVPPGRVTLAVRAQNAAGIGSDAVTLYAKVRAPDILVLLSWDTAGTDLDLHLTDPAGEECDYGHRRTRAGGSLEVDDTDGYGPEVFVEDHAIPGVYRVAVAAYDLGNAPQTRAEVLALVHPWTASERRYHFHVSFNREDENVAVGSFRVEAPAD